MVAGETAQFRWLNLRGHTVETVSNPLPLNSTLCAYGERVEWQKISHIPEMIMSVSGVK